MNPTGGSSLIPPDSGDGTGPSATGGGQPTSPPVPSAIVTSPWLRGADTAGGVVIDTDDGKRWFGRTPGEFAVIGSDGYRWFDSDGSAIGCSAAGSCVGVGPDGGVVISKKPRGLRDVFTADGEFVAAYTAKGDRKKGASAPKASMADLLTESGVDVASLVNEASLAPPFAGGATGDPHFVTAGGVRFTTQVRGQFVATTGDPRHEIQVQLDTMLHRTDVSLVGAVALRTDGTTVVVSMDGAVTIDGTSRAARASFYQIPLSEGAVVGRWPAAANGSHTVLVAWPDGESVSMTANSALGITLVSHLYPSPGVTGLFGDRSRTAERAGDLASRDGKVGDTAAAIESWRVSAGERLFDQAPNEVSGPPGADVTLDPGAKTTARKACHGHGFSQAQDLAACVFDVALTGDTGFVPGHAQLGGSVEDGPVAPAFADRWPALVLPSDRSAADFPTDGRLDFSLRAGQVRLFPIAVEDEGEIRFVHRTGCAVDQSPPGLDQPAMRVFDATGHPVSDRFALCGHEQTPSLDPGSYYLLVANGPSPAKLDVRIDVTLP